MKLGIVGLPNVGKSTLFNAITNAGAQAANYPFCTIEPNAGVVSVPDERLLVRQCLKALTEEEQQIVIFHAVAGGKHRQIAEVLGLPLSTVLSKYRRDLKKLRTALDQEVHV